MVPAAGTPTTAPAPYATLLSFSRYIGRTGPAKATFVGGLRRARQAHSGFNPHGQFVKALKADIQFRNRGERTAIAAAVDAVAPRWRSLYAALEAGGARYLESLGDPAQVELAQARDALGVIGGLTVKVNPQFGLRYADGRVEAVRLHFDEQPPPPELVVATLYLMDRHMPRILPKAEPVLVDLRRGESHRPDPKTRPDDVERWLAGEAVAFAAMWGAAA
ncbi:hypothetical protein GCM10023322_63830 [Rugosimonospora acidiphila]|uniref:Uncharacterized protein n=1 Tax=Rugosimonospora acidiphila TaxID=556531 RepID=A0ABP9SGI3_9ACTN